MRTEKMDLKRRKNLSLLHYLGGIFDGEGTACITRRDDINNYRSCIKVKMSDIEPIKLFSEYFGGNVRVYSGVNKISYVWAVGGLPAAKAAKILIKYVRTERRKLALSKIIDFAKTITGIGRGGMISKRSFILRETLHKECGKINTS